MEKFHNATIKSATLEHRSKSDSLNLVVHFIDTNDSSNFTQTFHMTDSDDVIKVQKLLESAQVEQCECSELSKSAVKLYTDYTDRDGDSRILAVGSDYQMPESFFLLDSSSIYFGDKFTKDALLNQFQRKNLVIAIQQRIDEIQKELNTITSRSEIKKLEKKISSLEETKREFEN